LDQIGIILDINLAAHFDSKFSEIHAMQPRLLTSGNKSSVDSYLSYVHKQINTHKISERVDKLLTTIQSPLFDAKALTTQLNAIDTQLMEILLAGEMQCKKTTTFPTGLETSIAAHCTYILISRKDLWSKRN